MRAQFPKVHEEVRIKSHPTGRVGIDPHHPATHARIELVIPATVERIGEVEPPSVAAHLHHLGPALHRPSLGMRHRVGQTTNTYGPRELWVEGVRHIVLAQFACAPARHVEKTIVQRQVDVRDQRRHHAQLLEHRRQDGRVVWLVRNLDHLADGPLVTLSVPQPDGTREVLQIHHHADETIRLRWVMRWPQLEDHLVVIP